MESTYVTITISDPSSVILHQFKVMIDKSEIDDDPVKRRNQVAAHIETLISNRYEVNDD